MKKLQIKISKALTAAKNATKKQRLQHQKRVENIFQQKLKEACVPKEIKKKQLEKIPNRKFEC